MTIREMICSSATGTLREFIAEYRSIPIGLQQYGIAIVQKQNVGMIAKQGMDLREKKVFSLENKQPLAVLQKEAIAIEGA